MRGMFSYCTSLKELPDISQWKTYNVFDMSFMFSSCTSLISLPDISKWGTYNVENMSGIFLNCSSLEKLPDIFKWQTNKVRNMSDIFANCLSLLHLPDISNWKTYNVINMSGMFMNCKKLLSLPDLSNWDTKNVINMNLMFMNCLSLYSLPNIDNKWNLSKATNKFFIFFNLPIKFSILDLYKLNIITKNDFIKFYYDIFSELYLNIKNIEKCLIYKTIFNTPGAPKFFIDYYNYLYKISNNYPSSYSKYNKTLLDANNIKMHRYCMIYIISEQMKKVRILGKEFVKNNKNKGKLIYKNHKFPLKEEIEIKEKNNILKVQMVLSDNIRNLSYMFKDCYYLLSFEEIQDCKSFEEREYSIFSEISKKKK